MSRKLFSNACLLMVLVVATLTGCSQTFVEVPPNYLGAKLTPTGFEQVIYTPGQVDIGTVANTGQQNYLILIQRSGLEIKEAFLCEDTECKSDHRVATLDKIPLTVDVRMLFALPDHTTKQGQQDVLRIFHLGNPMPFKGNARVSAIEAQSIYNEQAKLLVRGMIRQYFAAYANYEEVWKAFSAETEVNLSTKMQNKVVQILADQDVPLRVIGVQISNMKADSTVVAANVAIKAVDAQIEAITKMVKFLDDNPTAREIYKYTMLKDIVVAGGQNGSHTMLMTDLPNMSTPIVVVPTQK